MKKEKIPVYDICNLMDDKSLKSDFLIERLHHYLDHHYSTLHTPHRHSFFHLVLFTKGKGEHTIDFEKFKVEPFQIYFMIPGQVHGWNFEKDIDGFVINFSDTFFRSFLLSVNYLERFIFLNGTVTDGCFRLPDSIHKTVVDMLEEMLSINEKVQQSKEEDWLRIALLKFFMTISDRCFQPNKNAASSLKHQLLHDFRRLIEKHFHILKLPKEYADLLHVTPNHLNVLCNEMLGFTAGKLIRERLLLEAKRLLVNGDMTIAEIAANLNFEDNSYFNRFFKKYEGITPNDFRKQFLTV